MLEELTSMVAKMWGARAECVEAAALFAAVADRLGSPVQARAVSMVAVDSQERKLAVTGVAAGRDAQSRFGVTLGGWPEDTSASSFERAGHMILTSPTLSMMFDPTFQQFVDQGLPGHPLTGAVADVNPSDGKLVVEFGGGRFETTYFFDDENRGWQEGFGWAKRSWGEVAGRLASDLRSGLTANDVDYGIPWDTKAD